MLRSAIIALAVLAGPAALAREPLPMLPADAEALVEPDLSEPEDAESAELPMPEMPAPSGSEKRFKYLDRPAAPPLPPARNEIVIHGPQTAKQVALTFDACTITDPHRYDERITKTLIATNTPATLFVGGGWAQREPQHLRELARNPLFEIAIHGFMHPHFPKLTAAQVRADLSKAQAEFYAQLGWQPKLFRPPFGEYDEQLVRVAAELGLTTIEYDLPSGDPDLKISKDSLVKWVVRKSQPGSIVVMHINHPRFRTSEALPEIIEGLRARGFELVTVGRMLGMASEKPLAVARAGSKPVGAASLWARLIREPSRRSTLRVTNVEALHEQNWLSAALGEVAAAGSPLSDEVGRAPVRRPRATERRVVEDAPITADDLISSNPASGKRRLGRSRFKSVLGRTGGLRPARQGRTSRPPPVLRQLRRSQLQPRRGARGDEVDCCRPG